MAPPPLPTLADVARLAGVHPSTVSRTLARPDLVNVKTRRRVTEAVDTTGYRPNRAAQQLASGKPTSIAVLVPDLTNPFFAGVVRSTQQRAEHAGMLVVVADTGQRVDREIALIRALAPNVAGVIAASSTARSADMVDAAAGRPIVLINRVARGMSSVVIDQEQIIEVAMRHLSEIGHEHIAVIGGPSSYWSQQRRRDAIKRCATDPELSHLAIINTGATDATFASGASALGRVIAAEATAVFAFNDVVASGFVRACRQQHIDIPADVSLVGSDGLPSGALADPDLTTVAAPIERLGEQAVEVLLESLADGETQRVVLEPSLRHGTTTHPPRAGLASRHPTTTRA